MFKRSDVNQTTQRNTQLMLNTRLIATPIPSRGDKSSLPTNATIYNFYEYVPITVILHMLSDNSLPWCCWRYLLKEKYQSYSTRVMGVRKKVTPIKKDDVYKKWGTFLKLNHIIWDVTTPPSCQDR